MNSLRVGIIGLGGAGRAHARRLHRNPRVSKIFGYDPNVNQYVPEVERVSSRQELFDQVDAITICTPDRQHLDDIKASLKAGKHVLTEKPMVASFKEATDLRLYIKKYPSLVFGVHHQMRCAPAFLKAKDVIKSGVLGKLFYIEANYWHDMRDRAGKFDDWRQKEGQSLIFGHACHPLDLLMYLLDKTPSRHSTYLSKNSFREYSALYTSATMMLQFPENIIGKVHVNSSCVYPQVYDLVLAGDKGTYIDGVLYTGEDGFKQVASFFGRSGWLDTELIITKTRFPFPQKVFSLLFNGYMRTLNAITNFYMTLFSNITLKITREADFGFRRFPFTVYNHDLACQYIMDNFISSVLDGEKIMTGISEATRVIKLCEELEKEGLKNMVH